MGDGDGWIECGVGHRHWGRHGAAGLFLTDGDQVVLQHRSARTHEGGTWALPGGARDSHEDPIQTSLREAGEEAGIQAANVAPIGVAVADHAGWSYTTVVADAIGEVDPYAANWESDEVRWWPRADLDQLALHPGFALSIPSLARIPTPLTLIVDAANVVGSRPDGWWRDRVEASARLRTGLLDLARFGVPEDGSGPPLDFAGLHRLLPRIVMVLEGGARALPAEGRADWWQNSFTLDFATGSGDDRVVELAATSSGQVVVVTADQGLRSRLPAGVGRVGPTWLLQLIASN